MTARTSPTLRVTSACVRPETVTNSTSRPSGSYVSTIAPRSPILRHITVKNDCVELLELHRLTPEVSPDACKGSSRLLSSFEAIFLTRRCSRRLSFQDHRAVPDRTRITITPT